MHIAGQRKVKNHSLMTENVQSRI